MIQELVAKCRSYRRFYQEERIGEETLRELVDLARMTASTANSQALKYRLVTEPEECGRVYGTLMWAAALPDWDGPEEGERPAAYIIVACDQTLGRNKQWDEGIAAQTILLGAVERGLGGCMLGSVNRPKLAQVLNLDTGRYALDLVIALGRPKEQVMVVPVGEDGSVRYYRDENQVHCVPKRSLEDILL